MDSKLFFRQSVCLSLILFMALGHSVVIHSQGIHQSNSIDQGVLFIDDLPIVTIDSFIEANQVKHNIPAVSLALIKDGKIVYKKNYGVINAITKEPINETAVFEAASITKPVFGYVVCRMAQRGLIDLDAPLYERHPFPELEKYPCYKEMTARHILTHVSGLPNWGTEMIGCPGIEYGYSGQGFEYLTKVLAKTYTKKMDTIIMDHLNKEVLLPFDMSNTYFVESDQLEKLCVDGHMNNQPTEQQFPTSPGMAFSMHCNAEDIAKFSIALLNRTGLTAAMARDMFTPQTKVPDAINGPDSEYDQGIGLGLFLRDSPRGMVFSHSGSNGDFKCIFEVYDDLKVGYVIMTNSNTGHFLTEKMGAFLVKGKPSN